MVRIAIDLRFAKNFESIWNQQENQIEDEDEPGANLMNFGIGGFRGLGGSQRNNNFNRPNATAAPNRGRLMQH